MKRCFKGDNRGQALVETVLVLPYVFLFVALVFQLILLVHLQMKLQRSAGRVAHGLAMGEPSWKMVTPEIASYTNHLRWGAPLKFTGQLVPLQGVRAYPGPFSDEPRRCLAIADLTYVLRGDWFAKVGIRPLVLKAHAEMPCEPVMGRSS